MKSLLPSRYRWQKKDVAIEGKIIDKILYGRNIKGNEAIQAFLLPNKEQMHSPYLLNDMHQAVERVRRAKAQSEHIVIYGDYDVDGVTSTSILYMFLKEQGYSVSYYIPSRTEEGYGLNTSAIEKIRAYAALIITVDTGIAANQEVAFANSIGLDIIITDHHECQEDLPEAYCVLNPKRKDSAYPFDCLAGVGVTFKLMHGVALVEEVEDKIWKYMDIVALGTVADVVPLEGENRIITYLGFKQMEQTVHVGLQALIDVIPNKPIKITSNVIGYQLGPRINAAGRISDAKIGVELLVTTSKEEGVRIAHQLDMENKKRQDMEQAIVIQAEAYIEQYVDTEKDKIIIVAGDGWHHGVIGIVASRILAKYYKPTIVLTKEDGVYSGSARSVEGFNIFEAISNERDKLIRFGGHEMAAGLSLKETEFIAFKEEIQAYAEKHLPDELLTPSMVIDLEVEAKEMTLGLYDELERLEPFGVSNPMPTFCVQGIVQYAQKIGQDKHLKISVQKDNHVLHGVGFDKGYLVDELTEGEEVRIACELTKNVWNQKISVQLRIKDIQSPENKTRNSHYYLSLYDVLKEPSLKELKPSKYDEDKANSMCLVEEDGLKKVMTRINALCYNRNCDLKQTLQYEWEFKTLEGTHYMSTPLERHQEQLSKMIPTYSNCKEVYRFLKMHQETVSMHKLVEQFGTSEMTEYKALQILDIFSELKLLDYTFEGNQIFYRLLQSSKTKLEHSRRYTHLQEYLQNIRKL